METTGKDLQRDEVIELAMVRFAYTPEGETLGVEATFKASAAIKAEARQNVETKRCVPHAPAIGPTTSRLLQSGITRRSGRARGSA